MWTFLRIALAFMAGLIVTYLAVVVGALWYINANRIPDHSGGTSMAIMFAIGPLAGLIGGLVCAIAIPLRLGRRDLRRGITAQTPSPRRPRGQRVLIAVLAAGIPAYLLARFVFWLQQGKTYETYWEALLIGFMPELFAIAVAGVAALLASREPKPQT